MSQSGEHSKADYILQLAVNRAEWHSHPTPCTWEISSA